MSGLIVAHPGRQHSHHLALGLYEAGLLSEYWTGIPAHMLLRPFLTDGFWKRHFLYDFVPLPLDRVRHQLISPIWRKTLGRIAPEFAGFHVANSGDALFDAWSARRLRRTPGVEGIVAYENAALMTFREARLKGIMTVLDAASVHHQTQDALCGLRESSAGHQRTVRRKEAELALADYVLCVSQLAADSYRRAGLPEERIRVVTLGADLERFTPSPRNQRSTLTRFRFAFCGKLSHLKGVDILFRAFEHVRSAVPRAELHFYGSDDPRYASQPVEGTTITGSLSQSELAGRLADADCLVLPSRCDSFGMVVIEAMATGLPVIVSEQVGAKEAVCEGRHGWVVPVGDVEALARQMTWCARHPDEVRAMAPAVRAQARRYSWETYRRRIANVLLELLRSAPPRFTIPMHLAIS